MSNTPSIPKLKTRSPAEVKRLQARKGKQEEAKVTPSLLTVVERVRMSMENNKKDKL